MTKLNVSLTQSYRLTSDGERQFIVEQLVTVDPTKSPNWNAKLAEAAARGEVLDASKRKEWRQIDAYYPMTAKGLAAAIEFVAVRQAVEDGAAGDTSIPLAVFAQMMRGYSEGLREAVDGLIEGKAEVIV